MIANFGAYEWKKISCFSNPCAKSESLEQLEKKHGFRNHCLSFNSI